MKARQRIPLNSLLILGLLFLPGSRAFGRNFIQEDTPEALVRIDPGGDAGLVELASLELTIFETLYTSQGEPVLVAAADLLLQEEITRRGFKLSVLDPDLQDGEFSLLYGNAEDLAKAKELTQVLLVEGSMAVARTTQAQLAGLIALGLDVSPLAARPLIAPAAKSTSIMLPTVITPSPLVGEMIDQMSSMDLHTLVGGLSGEWAVTVNGAPYTIATRYTYSTTPILRATRYAYEFFEAQGLATWYDYYQISGLEKRNVLAQQTGLTQPDRIFLLTAHLDSTSYVNGNPDIFAPGADDNASGSAALLSIAEILSTYDFGCTLRYALFTGEEQGMFGSKAYAADIYYGGENLQGVLNIDMLGYSTPGSSPVIELHTRPGNAPDLAIANLFQDTINAYGIPLTPWILQDGKTFSDHSSFWTYGYPAVMAIEDWTDHTPYYHMTGDQVETLNFTYYTDFARAALATFAHMGCLLEGQISGTVRDGATNAPLPGASVEVWQNGVKIRSTTTLGNGSYQLALQPGSYTVTFSAADHLNGSVSNVTVSSNQSTLLDSSLTPCIFIQDAAISASNWSPAVGEMVSFNATIGAGQTPVSYSWDFGDGGTATGTATSHVFTNRGGYEVKLTTDNACNAPLTASSAVFVDVNLTFLPLVASSSGQ